MRSMCQLVILAALQVAAASVLDIDVFVPFFVIWCLAAIVLATEADGAVKRRTERINGVTGRPRRRESERLGLASACGERKLAGPAAR